MNLSQIANEVSAQIIHELSAVEKPDVIVLVGLQYAGKSYVSNLITSKNYAHFWATTVKKTYDLKNPEMIEVAKRVIEQVVNEGFNIVIDFVNHKKEIRSSFQAVSEMMNASYRTVFIATPKEERLKRREENIATGDQYGRRVISLEQMEEFESQFEEPTTDENVVTLKTQADVDNFIGSL